MPRYSLPLQKASIMGRYASGRKYSDSLLDGLSNTSLKFALKPASTHESTGIANPHFGLLATDGGSLRLATDRKTVLHVQWFTLRRCGSERPKAKRSSSSIGTRTSRLSLMLAVSTLNRKSLDNIKRVLTSVACADSFSIRDARGGKWCSHCRSKSRRTGSTSAIWQRLLCSSSCTQRNDRCTTAVSSAPFSVAIVCGNESRRSPKRAKGSKAIGAIRQIGSGSRCRRAILAICQ